MRGSYKKAIEDLKTELEALVPKRDEINFRIDRIQTSITALANMLDDPNEKLAELAEMNDIVGPSGLTDAVSKVVRSNLNGFTAVEVRDVLEATRFDLSKYSNALAAIHTTLKRLEAAKKIATARTPTGDTVYLWKEPVAPKVHVFNGRRRRAFLGIK
jgi:chromosome segregation ATPase